MPSRARVVCVIQAGKGLLLPVSSSKRTEGDSDKLRFKLSLFFRSGEQRFHGDVYFPRDTSYVILYSLPFMQHTKTNLYTKRPGYETEIATFPFEKFENILPERV